MAIVHIHTHRSVRSRWRPAVLLGAAVAISVVIAKQRPGAPVAPETAIAGERAADRDVQPTAMRRVPPGPGIATAQRPAVSITGSRVRTLRPVPSTRFVLLGVNLSESGARAIVKDTGTGRVVTVREGDRIDASTVTAIGAASVTLARGDYVERIGSMDSGTSSSPWRIARQGGDLPLPAPPPAQAGPYADPGEGHHGY